jgi:sensor c-di-GMP phosphodiesterase-like protein
MPAILSEALHAARVLGVGLIRGSSNAPAPIFDALVALARKLDVLTAAEGVETEEQHGYVGRRGVPLA